MKERKKNPESDPQVRIRDQEISDWRINHGIPLLLSGPW
jgi:hypothetical protein